MDRAVQAAREVLHNNLHGNFEGLLRTAASGYPEPYTRDMLISSLAALVTEDKELTASLRRILKTLAENQTSPKKLPWVVGAMSTLAWTCGTDAAEDMPTRA